MNSRATRPSRRERGFTLLELMVVFGIIALLIAVAIPTLLGARTRASDRAAQTRIRHAHTIEKVVYTDEVAYTTDTAAMVEVDPAAPVADVVIETEAAVLDSGPPVPDAVVCIDTRSTSGAVFRLVDVAVGPLAGTYFQKDAEIGEECAPGTEEQRDGW